MKPNRVNPAAGYSYGVVPKGPNGRALCRHCGEEVLGRRAWHGSKARFGTDGSIIVAGSGCLHEWLLGSNIGYQRKHVFARDWGVCATCAVDTEAIRRELLRLRDDCWTRAWGTAPPDSTSSAWDGRAFPEVGARAAQLGVPASHWDLRRSLWEMDHIIPVIEGG